MNKNDRRYRRTHDEIRKQFQKLILEKDYDEITITELAKCSNVNRKTFYLHYGCLNEMLEELQEEIISNLKMIHDEEDFNNAPLSPEKLMKRFYEVLSGNLPLHRRLFCSGSYRFVFDKIRETIIRQYSGTLQKQTPLNRMYIELFLDFISYGTLFIYRDWLSSDQHMDIEEFTRFTARLVSYSVEGFLSD